jgi:pimeloyl-ACP methyl ester carboxylesterase
MDRATINAMSFYVFYFIASLLCLPVSFFMLLCLLVVSQFRNHFHSFEGLHRSVISHPLVSYTYTDLLEEEHNAKVVHVQGSSDADNETLVIIHGTGGSSHSWYLIADDLASHYKNIYLLNLPGFGFSEGSKILLEADTDTIHAYYTHFIRQSFTRLNIQKATILAHSYGAILGIPYVYEHPETVEKLIIMAGPGVHPVFTIYGHYMGLLFGYNFPQRYIRYLGTAITKMIYTVYDYINLNSFYYYEIKLWERSWADELVKKHFSRSLTHTWFHAFTLKELLSLSVPVAFMHGEKDLLCPPHSSEIIKEITHHETPVYVIEGGGHNPAVNPNYKHKFLTQFLQATQYATPFPPIAKQIANAIDKSYLNNRFRCTYDLSHNHSIIENYYTYLRLLSQKIELLSS